MKRKLSILATALLLTACNQPNNNGTASGVASASSALPADLDTETKQVSYIFGYEIGANFAELKKNGGEVDVKIIAQAIQDQLDGKDSKLNEQQTAEIMNKFMQSLQQKAQEQAKANEEKGKKFLEENKAKEGVKTTKSGLQIKTNKAGSGESPAMGDGVLVEYEGRLIDGTVFDSTKLHGGEPLPVLLDGKGVIPGWTEGLQLMQMGGEYTLYIPAELAYGSNPRSSKIPSNAVLVFDIKVVGIEKNALKEENKPAQPRNKK